MTPELRQGDVAAFFDAPFNAYDPAGGYVSPMRSDIVRMLDPAKNPLWASGNPFAFWTAHRAGKPIGRVVAHVHPIGNSNESTARGSARRRGGNRGTG